MITVEAALETVLANTISLPVESVLLEVAPGRILREALSADRDFPPYDRVTMDGIALRYADIANKQTAFPIAGIVPAGSAPLSLSQAGQCLEVMTGAVLPPGTDTVIRYEDLEISSNIATLTAPGVRPGQNVHRQGEDRQAGELIVAPGCRITAAEIGVAATVGRTHLQVTRLPKTLIVSSGDELVEVGQQPLPHQIRRSNLAMLAAVMRNWGIQADTLHLPDQFELIQQRLAERLESYDLVLMSGGVSRGAFDYLPDVLAALGVKKLFHKVKQRPGKPFWFGRLPESTVVFALPGNPVSCFVCTLFYVRSWLEASMSLRSRAMLYAQLAEPFEFAPSLTYFLPVRLQSAAGGVWEALPVTGHGSGDLANLVDIDGFMVLPPDQQQFARGAVYPVIQFR